MKSIVIIGAGREQIPAYKIAKEMGLYIIGTDMDPNAPALSYADKKLICSTRNAEHTLEVILEYSKNHTIDGVMTIANDVPYTVSLIANKLKLPGISIQSAKYTSNKILMKKQFMKNNINSPKFEIVKNKKDFLKIISKKRFPLILKPSDGRGSRGVLFIDESIDLNWAWNHTYEISTNKELLLEEYIDGAQLSVEGIFYNEKLFSISFSDRNYSQINKTKPYIIEDGGIIPTKQPIHILEKISNLIENASKSLGIKWGSVKADIVLSGKEPKIIELASRLSGNYLATHQIPLVYQYNIVKSIIKMSIGEEIEKPTFLKKPKNYLGIRYFFPSVGKICGINGIEEISSLKFVKILEFFHKPGDIQHEITNNSERAGVIFCEGTTYNMARKRVEEVSRKINFQIKKLN